MQTKSSVLPPSIVLSPTTVYASQGTVYALEASSGTLRQRYQTQGLVYPTVVNDVIYISVNYLSSHMIQALRVSDGFQLWSHEVEGHLSSAPVVVEDVLYVSSLGVVYALYIGDGSLLWRYETGPILFAPPTVTDGTVYVSPAVNPPSEPFVDALDARNGSLLWRSQVSGSTSWPLVVLDGVLYMSSHSGCCALRVSNSSSLWQQKTTGQLRSSPVILDEIGYVSLCEFRQDFSSFESGQIKHWHEAFINAFRTSDGSFLWQQQLGIDTGAANPTSPIAANKVIYAGTDDGYISALQASDGALLWRYKTGGTWLSSPTVADGMLYVGANDGDVYALRANEGSLLWKTFISTSVTVALINVEKRK